MEPVLRARAARRSPVELPTVHYRQPMQSGQVSIWVPIVVGIIGLIGIVAGQLVNAWREDRRWRREQERV